MIEKVSVDVSMSDDEREIWCRSISRDDEKGADNSIRRPLFRLISPPGLGIGMICVEEQGESQRTLRKVARREACVPSCTERNANRITSNHISCTSVVR